MEKSKCKICRRLQTKLLLKGERCFSPKCVMVRRPYSPGKKGKRRSKTLSEYGRELREKQKMKNWYGLREQQFKNYAKSVISQKGRADNLSLLLLGKLENRLDNTIFRLGFAPSRAKARQMVSHNNFLVNGKPVNISSYQVQIGDVVSVAPRKQKKVYFQNLQPFLKKFKTVSWLSLDADKMEGKILGDVKMDEAEPPAEMESIFEFYAR